MGLFSGEFIFRGKGGGVLLEGILPLKMGWA